jgi:hypothetical protein
LSPNAKTSGIKDGFTENVGGKTQTRRFQSREISLSKVRTGVKKDIEKIDSMTIDKCEVS